MATKKVTRTAGPVIDLVDESKLEEKILQLENDIDMIKKTMLRQDASIFNWLEPKEK